MKEGEIGMSVCVYNILTGHSRISFAGPVNPITSLTFNLTQGQLRMRTYSKVIYLRTVIWGLCAETFIYSWNVRYGGYTKVRGG